jgi:hypothetical protein
LAPSPEIWPGRSGHERALPELLARVDVREVHLDHRQLARDQRVAQRHTRVCQPAGVDDDRAVRAARRLDAVDQLALVVGLERLHGRAALGRQLAQARVDLGQGGAAVDLRLALAEQVQIRAVQDQDLHRRSY